MRIFLFITILAFLSPMQLLACTCELEPLADVFAQSEQVFTARVTSVRMTAIRPVHNEMAQYVAIFERERTFKGMQADTFEVAFEMRWHDPYAEFKTISSCDWGFEIGAEYLFLRNEWRDFQVSFCSNQLHPIYRIDIDQVESLAAQEINGEEQVNVDSGWPKELRSGCARAA